MNMRNIRTLSLVVLLAAVPALLAHAKVEPQPLPVDQVPAHVKAIMTTYVPGMALNQATVKTDKEGDTDYGLRGTAGAREILVQIETNPGNELRQIRVEYEIDPALRKRDGFEPVELSALPDAVVAAAKTIAMDFVPDKAEHGMLGGRDGYVLEGEAAGFEVEIKLLANGEIVTIKKEIIE